MNSPEPTDRSRTLISVLVYGGDSFVFDCLESAALLARAPGVDVIVFDDHSPDPSWSRKIRLECDQLGLGYYRSPRNLGIPRNMNLALLWGADRGYDHVVIANSDVVFPQNLVPVLRGPADRDPSIASVTAWSNHVSSFSLENFNAPETIGRQDALDRVSSMLSAHFGDRVVEIPVGVGFCMLVPAAKIRQVGLFDPIFGRGYCEEVDWCMRATTLGFRNVLAPSTLVYHIGNATSKAFGVLEHWESSDPANEAIIDLRYPDYRARLGHFDDHGAIRDLREEAETVLVLAVAREHGYVIELSELAREFDYGPEVRIVVPAGAPKDTVRVLHGGFEATLRVGRDETLAGLIARVGAAPTRVVVRDRGRHAEAVVARARDEGIPVTDNYSYPQLVAPPTVGIHG